MKKSLCLLVTIALLSIGCTVKTNSDIKKETDEIIKKSQQDFDDLMKPMYLGGQPGKITIKGIVVKQTPETSQLDERITVTQVGGKGNRGVTQTLVSEENKAVLTEVVDPETLAKIDESTTFINMGCSDLSTSDTDGLTEELDKPLTDSVLSLSAKKIFICGPQTITQSFVLISADQLILKDASLEVKSSVGGLSVSANKLSIEGKNNLKTSGIDMTVNVLQAPSLDLVVKTELLGEGTLSLQSNGGNCIQADEKK